MTLSGENDLEIIAELLDSSEPGEFEKAIDNLRNLPCDDLGEVFTSLSSDSSALTKLGIAKAIGVLGCMDSIDLLIDLAAEPGKWFSHAERRAIRLAAIESLGVLKDSRGVAVLLDIVNKSHDLEVRLEAVKSLGLIRDETSVRPLLKAMNSHPHIALSAAGALALIGGEEAFAGLALCLMHSHEMVKSASVWALGEIRDPRAVGLLTRLMADSDPLLRRDITWALGRIGGAAAQIALMQIAKVDQDSGIRKQALKELEEIQGEDGLVA